MINDGTGIKPSVGEHEAALLLPWLISRTGATSIVDLGTGVGYLVRAAERAGIRCVGVEGEPYCASQKVCAEILVADVTQHVFSERFDLATSFECIEHIPIAFQPAFFSSAASASDRLICSIHIANGENQEHSCIRSADWWTTWLEERGAVVAMIDDFPLESFDCSVMLDLDMRGFKP